MGIGPFEIVVLAILAVVLFGPEKLPELAGKAARVLHYVRTIANDATGQLRRELGPEYADLDLRDLHPKTFVRKHLLDGVQPLVSDVRREMDEIGQISRIDPMAPIPPASSAPRRDTGPDKPTSGSIDDTEASATEKSSPALSATANGPTTQSATANGPTTQSTTANRPTIGEALFPTPSETAARHTNGVAVVSDIDLPPWDREAT